MALNNTSRIVLGFTLALAGATAHAQVPDALKAISKASEAPKAPAAAPSASKEPPKLPWEPAQPPQVASPSPKKPSPAAVTPNATKGVVDSDKVERIDDKMYPGKKPPKASASVKESSVIPRTSWADQMTAATEELALLEKQAALLDRQAKVDEMRKKLGVSTQHSGGKQSAPAEIHLPPPAVRSIDITRGRATAMVDNGIEQRVVFVGSTIGKYRIQEIHIDRVVFADSRGPLVAAVSFPALPSTSGGPAQQASIQPFLTPPQLPAPRVNGGLPAPQGAAPPTIRPPNAAPGR
ncbi:MAG: hypothetical protein LW865_01520 [Betaproteobacteria bacterium]|jgi:hypothetical protein|nr:hypothetical protein [Betaproteobacteria bacterium]